MEPGGGDEGGQGLPRGLRHLQGQCGAILCEINMSIKFEPFEPAIIKILEDDKLFHRCVSLFCHTAQLQINQLRLDLRLTYEMSEVKLLTLQENI